MFSSNAIIPALTWTPLFLLLPVIFDGYPMIDTEKCNRCCD